MEFVIYEKKDGIAKIIINREEKRNAINEKTAEELKEALLDAEKDPEVKVIILTGAGERAFCAGADLAMFKGEISPLEYHRFLMIGREFGKLIENSSKPVIASVKGYALGGGCELLLPCDFVIASETAKIGQTEIKTGGFPGWGGSIRLPRLVGIRKAKELILIGDFIDAKEAEKIGLINKTVPLEKVDEVTLELANKLKELSPVAMKLAKTVINKGLRTDIETALDLESEMNVLGFTTEDHREGARAFAEKRKPVWTGR